MELDPYLADLRDQLVRAADGASDEVRSAAERVASGLDTTARLAFLEVLSAAAAEITRDLAPGSVDVRLRGRDVAFVVDRPASEPVDEAPEVIPVVDIDDASTSRTTLRLPDALKARVDEAAAADGLSVNAWLVRAVAQAVQPRQRRSAAKQARTGGSFAGWAR